MGQLRTKLTELQKSLYDMDSKILALEDETEDYHGRIEEFGKKADEGYDVMYLYLIEKLKKSGVKKIEDKFKTKLSEVIDSELQSYMKGILQLAGDLKKVIAALNSEHSNHAKRLIAHVEYATSKASEVKKICDKKKKGLFKSRMYKDKIKGYLAILEDMQKVLKTQETSIQAAAALRYDDDWVDRTFTVSPSMTIEDLKYRTTMALVDALAGYAKNKKAIDNMAAKLRNEYKSVPGQLAQVKKWIVDADDMEETEDEGEETVQGKGKEKA